MKTKIILIILIPIIIILLSFRLVVFDDSFYKQEFKKYNIYDKIENADAMLNNLLNYLKNKEQLNTFNQKEQMHLKDVKSLIRSFFIILYISLIISIALLTIQFKKNKHEFKKILFYSGITSIIIILLLFITTLKFSSVFTNFHLIFFRNNLWLLNPLEDKLILLFPEQIFYDITKRILIYSTTFSIILIITSLALKKVLNITQS